MTSKTTKLDLDSRSLVSGRVVIEASAGTGKTYALTVLAVRHIAETELTANQLLMVTFTKAATAELRHKTRERAQEAVDCLRTRKQTEPWMNSMFASPETMTKAEKKLNAFISQFDETTITTIHGFCQIVLSRLGLNSPAPANYTVKNEIENIIDQSITDALASRLSENPALLYGRRNKKTPKGEPQQYHDLRSGDLNSSLSALKEAVKKIIGNSGALVLPQAQPSDFATNRTSLELAEVETLELAEKIAEVAMTIVTDIRRRCQDLGIITYNDMVRLVAQTLNPPEGSGEQLHTAAKVIASLIANQYQMIMVDEFQDTDLSQWSIFKRIYESDSDNLTLVTVGDPKQSIYRFRGADVQVYLDAVRPVSPAYELTTNHRSDEVLLSALDSLFLDDTQFDVAGDVKFKPVEPAAKNKNTRVDSKSAPPVYDHVPGAPLELRYLSNDPALGAGETPAEPKKDGSRGKPKKNNNDSYHVRQIFWRDACNHIVQLLSDGRIPDKKSEMPSKSRAIKPSDIAILVNAHRDAETAVNYLRDAGVPAVRLKTDSVFGSMAAMHLLMFLGAIANPGKPQFVRAFALSWFGSSSSEKLLTAKPDDIAVWQRECAESSELLQKRGFAALYLSFRNSTEFLARILRDPDGERHITDLDHLAEILTSIPRFAQKAGARECFKILQDLVEEHDDQNEEHLRRIEGDDDAVKVMTIHTSKGLQFPIVFLPTLHKKPNEKGNNPGMFSYKFDGEVTSRRVIDVASGFEVAKNWIFNLSKEKKQTAIWKNEFKNKNKTQGRKLEAKKDRFSESMRLFYVALTRAEHKVVAYWSAEGPDNGKGNIGVAFAKVLFDHNKTLSRIPTEKEALDNLMTSISKKSGGTIAAIALQTEKVDPLVWVPDRNEKLAAKVDVATFTRDHESVRLYGFARWSYSDLSKALKGEKVNEGGDGAPGTDESSPVVEEEQTSESDDVIEAPKQSRNVDVHIKTEDVKAAMPLFGGAAGTSFGVAVHKIYKEIDPSKIDIENLIVNEVAAQFESWSDEVDKSKISDGIIRSIDSPLGIEFGGKTLRSLGAAHRLAELSFDFRLTQDKAFKLSEIGNLMLKHGDLNEELSVFAQRLVGLGSDNQQIAGYMTGSIDAVFRIIDSDNNVRYILSDYKSDQLHDPKAENENPLTGYHPECLTDPMVKKGYILQILVYSVALHRYLKWRQPEYDPEKHLGGAAYLFIRGMIGFETSESPARPYGVYFWRPPTKLILSLDALFAGKPL